LPALLVHKSDVDGRFDAAFQYLVPGSWQLGLVKEQKSGPVLIPHHRDDMIGRRGRAAAL
jgi:hypothetical protein